MSPFCFATHIQCGLAQPFDSFPIPESLVSPSNLLAQLVSFFHWLPHQDVSVACPTYSLTKTLQFLQPFFIHFLSSPLLFFPVSILPHLDYIHFIPYLVFFQHSDQWDYSSRQKLRPHSNHRSNSWYNQHIFHGGGGLIFEWLVAYPHCFTHTGVSSCVTEHITIPSGWY